MVTKINITVGGITLNATLYDKPTARNVLNALPLSAQAHVGGDEIYFEIPVIMPEEPDARQDVEIGTLAYWPVGHAFCIFYGPTPVSRDTKPRAYSPVNILGKIDGDATVLRGVESGTPVRISRL